MKLLLSFVNSELSLAGFDWDTGSLFWSLGAQRLRACGICYDGTDLLVSSDDQLRRLSPNGETVISLPGPHPALLHSVHHVGDHGIGVVDTGNSAVRVYDRDGRHCQALSPVGSWPDIPTDAIHLNDFAVTPRGIVASCFDFRPWRAAREAMGDFGVWSTAGLGLLINLSEAGHGRVVACGIDHPHSLVWREPHVCHCSSATGAFHVWEFREDGMLNERRRIRVTDKHFLRGALYADGAWFLGGSTARHGQPLADRMAVYRLDETSEPIDRRWINAAGEIYDILPWHDDVMRSIVSTHFGGL